MLRLFERLASRERPLAGAALVLVAGAAWAALCWQLAEAGHAPSRVLLPLARQHYYRAQALFVTPLLFAQWLLCALVAQWVARGRGGRGSFVGTANALGVALALPLLCLFVLPDAITYAAYGFSALGKLVRVTAPLSFGASVWLATFALRAAHHIPTSRALLAALSGVLLQSLVGSPLLR